MRIAVSTRYNESIIEYIEELTSRTTKRPDDVSLNKRQKKWVHTTLFRLHAIAIKANDKTRKSVIIILRDIIVWNTFLKEKGIFPQTVLGVEDLRIKW